MSGSGDRRGGGPPGSDGSWETMGKKSNKPGKVGGRQWAPRSSTNATPNTARPAWGGNGSSHSSGTSWAQASDRGAANRGNPRPPQQTPRPVLTPPLENGWQWPSRPRPSGSEVKKDDAPPSGSDPEVENVDCNNTSDDDDDLSGDISDDYDSDASEKSFDKWFKEFFEVLNTLSVEQINEQARRWHCPACQNGPGAIDWYKGLQPLMTHARTKGSIRVRLHRKLAALLEEELSRRGTTVVPAGEQFGKWEGLRESTDREIVWPPMVIVMNTFLEKDDDDKWKGMGNQELLDYFGEYAATKAHHAYGPSGHRGMSVLIFESSTVGYMEAERLHRHFVNQGTDRNAWHLRKVRFVPGGKRQLYGFLASKEDMEAFNKHCHGKSHLKYEMRSYNEMVVIQMKQMSEDNQQLNYVKNKIVKTEQPYKPVEETLDDWAMPLSSQILLQEHTQFQQQPYLQNISQSTIPAQGQSEFLKQLMQRHQSFNEQQPQLQPQQHQESLQQQHSEVQFTVRLGGRSLSMQQVLEEMTVKMLIEYCCKEIGIRETKAIYGVLCGKILSDEIFLSQYPIHRDSSIDLRSRLRGGKLETYSTRFSKPDVDLFYSVALSKPLENWKILDNYKKTSKCVWKLKRHIRFSVKLLFLFFTGQHRDNICYNGAFEKDDIMFENGRAYLRAGITPQIFSGSGCKLDYYKLFTILKELKTSDGYYTQYFPQLLDYLQRCPFGENSKSDLAISFLINFPAIEHFNDRMKQVMLMDAFLFRVSNADINTIRKALGKFPDWWLLLEECPAMKKVLDRDSYTSGGTVYYNPLYTNGPSGCFHYSNNFFKHAKKTLGLEEIEAAHSVNAPNLLPKVFENIIHFAINPKNAGFADQFKTLLDLIQNDLADPQSEHSQDN